LVFGGTEHSRDVANHAFQRLEQAVAEGVAATLPGNMIRDDNSHDGEEEDGEEDGQGGSRAMVDELLRPYRARIDAFELFCRRNVFSLQMYERSRREQIVQLISSASSMPSSEELSGSRTELQGDASRGTDERHEGSVVVAAAAVTEDDLEEVQIPSPDEVPTEAQMEEMKEKVKRLRSRWEDVRSKQELLAQQVEEWQAAESSMERASASLPGGLGNLLSARNDDAKSPDGENRHGVPSSSSSPSSLIARLYEAVSSALIGRSALLEMHEESLELLKKLQQQAEEAMAAKNRADGDYGDDDNMEGFFVASLMEDENEVSDNPSAKKHKTLSLEEEYARDRGAVGRSLGDEEMADEALSFDRLKRQLREGSENTRSF
jgi:hypothetical protein